MTWDKLKNTFFSHVQKLKGSHRQSVTGFRKVDLGFLIWDINYSLGQSCTHIEEGSGQLLCKLAKNDPISLTFFKNFKIQKSFSGLFKTLKLRNPPETSHILPASSSTHNFKAKPAQETGREMVQLQSWMTSN